MNVTSLYDQQIGEVPRWLQRQDDAWWKERLLTFNEKEQSGSSDARHQRNV